MSKAQTAKERKAAEVKRRKAAGFKRVEAWVHISQVPAFKSFVERLRAKAPGAES